MAPASNLYPPAAPSTSPTPCIGINSNDPGRARPIQIVFSASLERSLLSLGKKRRPSVLRSSSSWSAGHPSRGKLSSPGKKSSQHKGKQGAPPTAANSGHLEEGGNPPATATATRRRHGLRGSLRVASTGPERSGGGATHPETIIDTNSSRPPEGQRRCRQNLHDPTSPDRPSAAAAGTDGAHGLASKEQAQREKSQDEGITSTRQDPSLAAAAKQPLRTGRGNYEGGEIGQHASHSIPRGRRSGRGTLPAVKCWEGAESVTSGGKNGGPDGESQTQKPRGRPVRSRSYVDTISAQGTGESEKASGALTDGMHTRNRMEAGSAGVVATVGGRNGGGVTFGRESSNITRFRQQQGRGEAGMRAAGGNSANGGGTPGELLHEERILASRAAANASSSTPPLLQLPASPATADASCCDFEENLSVCSSLPPMTGAATNTTDLIFEESSFEDSGASVSQASSTERNGNDTRNGGGGGGSGSGNGEGGGAAGRGRRAGGGGSSRQRSGVFSDDLVRTRCDHER